MCNHPRRLVVFDFDWSLIDNDSDNWIIAKLPEAQYARYRTLLAEKMQWTDLMNQMVGELHEQGFTQTQIEETLSKIPFHPSMLEAIKLMKDSNMELIILSDSNTVYIEIILKVHLRDGTLHRSKKEDPPSILNSLRPFPPHVGLRCVGPLHSRDHEPGPLR
ncbi:hypothetical protein BC936DRAFT_147015 [Jimgerdemannia flammicorona]|uniref:Uncharacterized protein n=1 Tax=Jimgerdemannia flammicorona TaxID=994334 RepID=A0A433D6D0_9FUNG|nr:hypothetical protein BC936DRAFT_147015 [Jimgerdemannia flammicorona]